LQVRSVTGERDSPRRKEEGQIGGLEVNSYNLKRGEEKKKEFDVLNLRKGWENGKRTLRMYQNIKTKA